MVIIMPSEREKNPKSAEASAAPVAAPLPLRGGNYRLKKVGIPEVDRNLEAIFAPEGGRRERERMDAADAVVGYLELHTEFRRADTVEELRKAFSANAYKTDSKLRGRLAYAMGRLGVETPFKMSPLNSAGVYELGTAAACLKGVKAALKSGESDGVLGDRLERTRMFFKGQMFESGLRLRPPVLEPYLEVLFEAVTRRGGDGNPLMDPRTLIADAELIDNLEWAYKDGTDGGAKKAAKRLYKALKMHTNGT
jgi:hypothetical protein